MYYKEFMIEQFADDLGNEYKKAYGHLAPECGEFVKWMGRFAIEHIANSDMLYHDVEHTMLVTLVGQEIVLGKHLKEGGVKPQDWMHFMTALLCHDMGYVRGTCRGDVDGFYATGIGDEKVELPAGCTDAALTPYHVDRSKLFVSERFSGSMLVEFDASRVCSYIELTRFPPPKDPAYDDTRGFAGLLRAADFIGQLGDPDYLRKIPALFYEFEQIGSNEKIGYKTPGDMRAGYAGFFWNVVHPYIRDAIKYLRVTQKGKAWVDRLHAHVFEVEHFD
jgi:hypothetical protein